MAAPLSVVIPALDAAGELASCLESLMPGLTSGLVREVVLVDGGSQDATCAMAEASGCHVISSERGRAKQLRAGARAARSDWLLFLHADTALSPDWAERSAVHIETAPGKAACFKLAFRSDAPEAKWLAARANRRTRWLALPYGDQGLLISRDLYDAVGGFPDIALMEDVAIVRAIGRKRLAVLSATARTSAAKYERDGWRRRARRNAVLITRYLLGADPDRLARKYT